MYLMQWQLEFNNKAGRKHLDPQHGSWESWQLHSRQASIKQTTEDMSWYTEVLGENAEEYAKVNEMGES